MKKVIIKTSLLKMVKCPQLEKSISKLFYDIKSGGVE